MLETMRLLLRPMRAEDLDDLLGVFGDPRVMAAFGHPPFDRWQMERWLRRNLNLQEEFGYGLFSVVLKSTGLLIGDCGLERMDEDGSIQAELGFDLRSDHWNRGYATEAAVAVRDFAFGVHALPRLISLIRQGNEASRRVAEKVGLRLAAEEDRAGVPYWVFSLTRDEYLGAASR